ncbi:MAG: CAP domain-containing protein [Kineosporiaceae bacterium]
MAGGSMDERRGRPRTSIRHRGERRYSLARIGPAVLALELVIVLLAGTTLYLHERGPQRNPRNTPGAAAELPSLLEPEDGDSATGSPSTSPTATSGSPTTSVLPATGTHSPSASTGGTAGTAAPGGGSSAGGGRTTSGGSSGPAPGRTTPRSTGGSTAPATRPATTRPPVTRPTTPPRTSARPQVPTRLPDPGVAAQLVSHLNGRRAGAGCPALRLDARLSRAAQGHADDMVSRRYFRHTSPDGLGPGDRAAQQGWTQPVAEVLAVGFENAARAVDGWWDSPAHHGILTTCSYRSIGIGWNPGQPLSTNASGAWVALLS